MEEEKDIIFDDDGIEILDFDDDIVEESPELEEIIIEDVDPIQEIIELPIIKEDIKESEPVIEKIKETQSNNKIISPNIEKTETGGSTTQTITNNIDSPSNTDLLNNTLRLDKNEISDTLNNDSKIDVEEIKNVNVLGANETPKETIKVVKKKIKWKSIILGILIFGALFGAIIALPFLSDYFNRNIANQQTNKDINNSESQENEKFVSNINVKKALEGVKDYKNYQYQNTNIISTKDNTEQLMSIKNNYIYNINETKYEIYINKAVADFSYEVTDYYEKLDDIYNLYINDITTKTYTKKNTTIEEFDKINNIFPNMINYLINNYNISDEKLLKVDSEEHIDITLKVPKDIVNIMSLETDRIQNKIDSAKLEQEFIYVDLLFDENKKLYKIEIEIEDKNACEESLENEIESAILRYVFTDFNRIDDIILPSL